MCIISKEYIAHSIHTQTHTDTCKAAAAVGLLGPREIGARSQLARYMMYIGDWTANQKGGSFIMAGTSNSLMGCFREFGTLPQSAYMYTLGSLSLSLCVCAVCYLYNPAVAF